MAGVHDDRRRLTLAEAPVGRRSAGVLVMMLIAVLAAIALIWNVSRRRPTRLPASPIANLEPAVALPTEEAEPATAPGATAAAADEGAATARRQEEIARVVSDGRGGLKQCYQRALVRDDRLVNGRVTVRVSVAASGKAELVRVSGPAAFRAMQPCFEETISRWSFPTASEPYVTEFPLTLQGRE